MHSWNKSERFLGKGSSERWHWTSHKLETRFGISSILTDKISSIHTNNKGEKVRVGKTYILLTMVGDVGDEKSSSATSTLSK